MRRPTLVLFTLMLAVMLLTLVRSAFSNSISPNGVVLGKIEAQTENLKKENMDLQEELYTKTSLLNISSQAAKMGFVEKGNSFAVTGSLPIALKR